MTIPFRLKALLTLQISYALIGFLFNSVSALSSYFTSATLTETQPMSGILAMVLVSVSAFAGIKGKLKICFVLNLLLIAPLISVGAIRHLHTLSEQSWDLMSNAAVAFAAFCNIIGVLVMSLVLVFILIQSMFTKGQFE